MGCTQGGMVSDDPNEIKRFPGFTRTELAEVSHIGYGNLKKENQDRTVLIPSFAGNSTMCLAAVFDGHGQHGKEAANVAAQHLPVVLKKELGELHRGDPTNSLIQAFLATDKRLVAELGQDAADFSGCTGTVALQQGNMLYVACVGDSRAVLAYKDGARFECNEMSRDHRPSLPDERNRILEMGGRVEPKKLQSGDYVGPTRVWLKDQNLPGLLVTRSLGDALAHSVGCLAEPEVQKQVLDKSHQFLVIASDGVWDVMNNDQVTEEVRHFVRKPQQAVDHICETSLERWGEKGQADNIGIAIMRFR